MIPFEGVQEEWNLDLDILLTFLFSFSVSVLTFDMDFADMFEDRSLGRQRLARKGLGRR